MNKLFSLIVRTEAEVAKEVVTKTKPQYNFFTWNLYLTDKKYFKVNLPDILPNLLKLTNREDGLRLERNPLKFYQNQFNMAVWFATTGCGISVNNHLNHSDPMIRSVYRFHTYYHIRRIFKFLQIPIPGDDEFHEFNNFINRNEYKKLIAEFGLNRETAYQHDGVVNFSSFDKNEGWEGFIPSDYNPNITDPGYYINDSKINFFLMQVHENRVPPMFQTDFDNGMDNFKYPDGFIKAHVRRHKNIISSVTQKPCQTYQHFMVENTENLTKTGIEWLNESIRTYVYCILAAQTDARTPIVGSFGTELDAQKQFIILLENVIEAKPDISTSITNYQNALTEAHKQLDYVIAPGLYIIPSDMILKIKTIYNYNNNILIATKNMKPGKNNINFTKQKLPPLMEGSLNKKSLLKTNSEKIEKPEKPEKFEKPEKLKKEAEEEHETIKFILFGIGGVILTFLIFKY